jgi:hypothetical protein
MTYQQQPMRIGPSRRKVILTGAGIAAAGVAVGAGIPLVANQISDSDDGGFGEAGEAPKKPVMVHLKNASSGEFDVFVGTSRVTVTDAGFAAKLSKAAAQAEGE